MSTDFLAGLFNKRPTNMGSFNGNGAMSNMAPFQNEVQPDVSSILPGFKPGDISNMPANLGGDTGGGLSDWLFGNDKKPGNFNTLAGIGTSLMDGFLGWQEYKLQKDKFKFEKDAWEKNWGAQTTDYNRQVSDVANARASATGDFAGRDEYINKNRLT